MRACQYLPAIFLTKPYPAFDPIGFASWQHSAMCSMAIFCHVARLTAPHIALSIPSSGDFQHPARSFSVVSMNAAKRNLQIFSRVLDFKSS